MSNKRLSKGGNLFSLFESTWLDFESNGLGVALVKGSSYPGIILTLLLTIVWPGTSFYLSMNEID